MLLLLLPGPQQVEHATSSKDWALDPAELSSAFSPRTKMIIINNPNNPLGKVRACNDGVYLQWLELDVRSCSTYTCVCVRACVRACVCGIHGPVCV